MPATDLRTARSHYARQRRISGAAVASAVAAWRAGRPAEQVVVSVQMHQQAAAAAAIAASGAMLTEQRFPVAPVALVAVDAFRSDPVSLLQMLAEITSAQQLRRLVGSLVPDAGRAAQQVDLAARPTVEGHVRYLQLPSCSRCAILAGRFYRWSEDFRRHPECDCVMLPTREAPSASLVSDPSEAVESGQVTGLSKADLRALAAGADLNQIVNVRRKKAGLSGAGEVLARGGRPTPAGIFRLAEGDRDRALVLLEQHGYIL